MSSDLYLLWAILLKLTLFTLFNNNFLYFWNFNMNVVRYENVGILEPNV